MSGMFVYSREAVRVKVKKCEGNLPPEWRKFSVDPQITSLEVLYSILAKAFDLKTDFGISYKATDPSNGQDIYLPVLSDYDLDAAFLRAHNQSITISCEPCLNLRVDIKPFSEASDWETTNSNISRETSPLQQSINSGHRYVQTVQNRLPGLIMNQMEKTFSMVQRALNLVEDSSFSQPPRQPLCDTEFRGFLDSVGQIVHTKDLRNVIFIGGIEPSLRRVVWKHILNVYPDGMTGRERMDYMKRKSAEYYRLRDKWKTVVQKGGVTGELAYVTSMVRKDVLRTDRLHTFYAGSDDNQNIAALFNILTTYAVNHPAVSYCQGMSDIASPLLVTMGDEAQAYICFCAIMSRLRTNFMLDGIAMTTKFSHLTEALQYYDPEFYDYLKSQQADDLLFCYRWLLLEMKREFPFDDSLRMAEVLWSSLPSTPQIKELALFEKEFEPPANDIPIPKSPSVILRTPRENPYTKICALRRQSSALSLYSSSFNHSYQTNTAQSNPPHKLDLTKRMNLSLDETVTRNLNKNQIKTHQSLDESKMFSEILFTDSKDDTFIENKSSNVKLKNDDNMFTLRKNIERPRSVSPQTNKPNMDNLDLVNSEQTSSSSSEMIGKESDQMKEIAKDSISTRDDVKKIESCSGRKIQNHHHRGGLNQISNKSIFCSTGNLITKQISANKKSGHFRDLKEKIVASKKGIFASLDKIESLQSPSTKSDIISSDPLIPNKKQSKSHKVVKNFNEFLSFASMNKSRISDKLSSSSNSSKTYNLNNINNNSNKTSSTKPLIKLTKSSFDDSESTSDNISISDNLNNSCTSNKINNCDSNKKTPLQLQLTNIMIEKQQSFDGNSPDDSQEYFPMTTSMTRELRLELENLDRHVFGTDFHHRTQFNVLSGCDTPESGDSVDKAPYSEIIYKKLNQNCSVDCIENDSDCVGDSNENISKIINEKSNEIYSCPPIINGVRNRIKTSSNYDENNTFKRISTSSANNDVFIWENPLHQFSSNSSIHQTVDVDVEPINNQLKNMFIKKDQIQTPDEQCDLDYDGEIIEENNLGKKSVTPIRLLRKNGETSNSNSNRNSMLNDIDSDNSDSWNENNNNNISVNIISNVQVVSQKDSINLPSSSSLTMAQHIQPPLTIPIETTPILNTMTNSCEEASEAQNLAIELTKVSGILPPPTEFGCGNPFLMFLCLTLLLQHRDVVIKSGMDYNEMAMYFDKMVRKHNVTRVLNQARRMYAEYLKSQRKNSTESSNVQTVNGSGSNSSSNLGSDINT